jgi:hypothetical protein
MNRRVVTVTTPFSEDSANEAGFVFIGTVEEAGSSTVRAVRATDSTAVVRVDEVVRAPTAFRGLEGQRITVLLRTPGRPREGEQATFAAHGVAFGESIAVEEIDHSEVRAGGELRAQLAEISDQRSNSAIGARIASADVVVEARVAQVRPTAAEVAEVEPGLPGPLSEHYPDWMEATLDISAVLKGTRPQDPTVLLFPASIDIMWVSAPKFHAGQEGIWLLHSEQVPQAAARAIPSVYTALAADDFQPRERAEQIHGMIEELGG